MPGPSTPDPSSPDPSSPAGGSADGSVGRLAGPALAGAVLLSLVVLFAPSGGGAPDLPGLDKVVHLGLFALLAGTARWRLGPRAAVAVGLVAYAVASELGQGLLLDGRSGDPADVLADLAGAGLGWLVAGRLLTRRLLDRRRGDAVRPARRSPGG